MEAYPLEYGVLKLSTAYLVVLWYTLAAVGIVCWLHCLRARGFLPREYCSLGFSNFTNRMSTLPTASLASKEHKSSLKQQCFVPAYSVLVKRL